MKRTLRRLMLIMMLICVPAVMMGCPETPFGTVTVMDEAGNPIASAWDRDLDGEADKDPVTGEVDLVLPKEAYTAARRADIFGPEILQLLAAFGVPFVGMAAVWWRKYKFGLKTANLVTSIQAARASIKANGAKGSLVLLDDALKAAQDPDTAAMVADLKKAAGLPSVSEL